jgi:hypothetical protein
MLDASSQAQLTPYQTKYYAYQLTRRCPTDSMEKLAGALVDAQVDLNPHQVEAALFAFRSPLSRRHPRGRGRPRQDHRGGPRPLSALGRAQAAPPRHNAGESAQTVVPGAAREVLSAKSHPGDQVLQRRGGRRRDQSLRYRRGPALLLSVRTEQGGRYRPHPLGPRGHRRGAPPTQRLQEGQRHCPHLARCPESRP